ncbi:MAG: hypothetical protein JJU05_16355 [Verrucomicrobia bacterium]|nr:hypothetical protein [Verrucomicrobiota bacterium]
MENLVTAFLLQPDVIRIQPNKFFGIHSLNHADFPALLFSANKIGLISELTVLIAVNLRLFLFGFILVHSAPAVAHAKIQLNLFVTGRCSMGASRNW